MNDYIHLCPCSILCLLCYGLKGGRQAYKYLFLVDQPTFMSSIKPADKITCPAGEHWHWVFRVAGHLVCHAQKSVQRFSVTGGRGPNKGPLELAPFVLTVVSGSDLRFYISPFHARWGQALHSPPRALKQKVLKRPEVTFSFNYAQNLQIHFSL